MAYTKKELIAALSSLEDDAEIEINISITVEEGVEEGTLYPIGAVAISGTTHGQIVGYDD